MNRAAAIQTLMNLSALIRHDLRLRHADARKLDEVTSWLLDEQVGWLAQVNEESKAS